MALVNTLAYYDSAAKSEAESFIVQARKDFHKKTCNPTNGVNVIKLFGRKFIQYFLEMYSQHFIFFLTYALAK